MIIRSEAITLQRLMTINLFIAVSVVLVGANFNPHRQPTIHTKQLSLASYHRAAKPAVRHKLKVKAAQPPAPPPIRPDFTLPPVTDGLAPAISHIPTTQPVVFLTIDDGAYKGPEVIQALAAQHIQATLFLAKLFISDDPQFFEQISAQGSFIEDHTLSHDTDMTGDMTGTEQQNEICGMADYEQQQYGRRPLLFRPPGGAYNGSLRAAAAACGMRAVVTWSAKANGGSMQYQVGNGLRPGDIVLMHFRPEFLQDLQAFIAAQQAAGLQIQLLENWLLAK